MCYEKKDYYKEQKSKRGKEISRVIIKYQPGWLVLCQDISVIFLRAAECCSAEATE